MRLLVLSRNFLHEKMRQKQNNLPRCNTRKIHGDTTDKNSAVDIFRDRSLRNLPIKGRLCFEL